MRVLHVIPAIAPRYGGPSAAVLSMCRALNERGSCRAEIATTDADGPDRLAVDVGATIDHDRVSVTFFKRAFSESFKYSGGLADWLIDKARDFDVIHIHAVFSHSSIAAARAARRARVPYIVRPIGSLDPWGLSQRRLRKEIFFAVTGNAFLRDAAAVHFSTAAEKQHAEKRFPALRSFVIPLGIDEVLLQPDERDRRRSLLFLGRLHPVKNLEAIIAAFASAMRSGDADGWSLIIAGAGDPDYERALRHDAAMTGASDAISFRGWVSGTEKADLLRSASVLIAPSMQESFGIAVAEAMGCGLPVIISRDVNLSDAIEEANAGWILEGTSADRLHSSLKQVFADAEGRRKRGENAQRYARAHFRWSEVAARLEEMYGSVVSRGPDDRRTDV